MCEFSHIIKIGDGMDTIFSGIVDAFKLILSGDVELYRVMGLSIFVSLTSVFIASLIGLPLGVYFGLKEFKAKKAFARITYTLMSMPPVVMGLIVYMFISRRGPLGSLRLLYTPAAMIIAQSLLIFPIIMGYVFNSVKNHGHIIRQSCFTLGASHLQTLFVLMKELRTHMLMAVVTGFGRAISEVGAVMLVGGNIAGKTRVMTTFIALNNSMGNYSKSIAMGIVLLMISFFINYYFHKFIGDHI